MSEVSAEGQDILAFLRDGSGVQKMVENMHNEIQEIQNNDMDIVNVTKTMKDLTQIGYLLQVANKTSIGYKCNVAIKTTLIKYQMLLSLCITDLDDFKLSARSALESHIDAVDLIDGNEIMEALSLLEDCVTIANKLAEKAENLAKESDAITKDCGKALTEATSQDVANRDRQLELTVARQQMNAKKAKSETLEREYANEVAKYRKLQAEAETKAETEGDRAFWLAMVGAIGSGLHKLHPLAPIESMGALGPKGTDKNSASGAAPGNADKEEEKEKLRKDIKALEKDMEQTNEEIKEKSMQHENEEVKKLKEQLKTQSDKKEEFEKKLKGLEKFIDRMWTQAANNASAAEANLARIREILDEKRTAEIENKAELAKLACELQNSDMNLDDISTAIEMIGLTMLTLGKVVTAMNNTAQFWRQQANQCERLAALGKKGDRFYKKYEKEQKQSFLKIGKKSIRDSGMTWLTLYAINSEAVVAIRPAKEKIDQVMCDLGGFQSKKEIIEEVKKVLGKIEDWNNVEPKAIESNAE